MIIMKKHRSAYRKHFGDRTDYWDIKIPSLTWWTLCYGISLGKMYGDGIFIFDVNRIVHGKV